MLIWQLFVISAFFLLSFPFYPSSLFFTILLRWLLAWFNVKHSSITNNWIFYGLISSFSGALILILYIMKFQEYCNLNGLNVEYASLLFFLWISFQENWISISFTSILDFENKLLVKVFGMVENEHFTLDGIIDMHILTFEAVVEFMNAIFSGMPQGLRLQIAFTSNSCNSQNVERSKKFLCARISNVTLCHSNKPFNAVCFEY